jgi:hypothetical protein
LGLIFSDGAWDALAMEISQGFQSPRLIAAGPLLYSLSALSDQDMTEIWSYRAFYYEIFMPIIQ